MAEVAKLVGVSERSLRRWKNEGVQPRDAGTAQRLTKTAAEARRRVRRAGARGADRFVVPNVPVPPITKRIYWRADTDPPGKRTRRSDTISHDLRGLTIGDVLALLRYYAVRRGQIRFVYRVPKGGTSLGGREYNKAINASTGWITLTPWLSDDRLLGMMYDLHPSGTTSQGRRLLYLMVQSDEKGLITSDRGRTRADEKKRATRTQDKSNRKKGSATRRTKGGKKRKK